VRKQEIEMSEFNRKSTLEKLDSISTSLRVKRNIEQKTVFLKRLKDAVYYAMAVRFSVDMKNSGGRIVESTNPRNFASFNTPFDPEAIQSDLDKLLGKNPTPDQKAMAERVFTFRDSAKISFLMDGDITMNDYKKYEAIEPSFDQNYNLIGQQKSGNFDATLNETIANGKEVVSSELRIFLEKDTMDNLRKKEREVGYVLDYFIKNPSYVTDSDISSQPYPELTSRLKMFYDSILAKHNVEKDRDEFESLIDLKRDKIAKLSNVYDKEEAEALELEIKTIDKRLSTVRTEAQIAYDKARKEYNSSLPKAKEYIELKDILANTRQKMTITGTATFEAILSKSTVTSEKSKEWAKNNVTIGKNARSRLKRNQYDGDIDADIEEFYQLTGGKLNKVEIITDGAKRAHTKRVLENNNAQIFIDGNFNKSTLFHELGHNLEFDPKASMLAQEFLKRRRESDKLYKLRQLTGSKFYGAGEMAFKDSWISPYVGKFYKDGATEVFAMGLQEFSSPQKLQAFMQKDPEHFDLIVGYLTQKYDDLSQFNFDLGKVQLDKKKEI
jgi:hypothetical protein